MKYKNSITNCNHFSYLSRSLYVNILLIGLYIMMSSAGCSRRIPITSEQPTPSSQKKHDPTPSTKSPTPSTPEEREKELKKKKKDLDDRKTFLSAEDDMLNTEIEELKGQKNQITIEANTLKDEINTLKKSIQELEKKTTKTQEEIQQNTELNIEHNLKLRQRVDLLDSLASLSTSLVNKYTYQASIRTELIKIVKASMQVTRDLRSLKIEQLKAKLTNPAAALSETERQEIEQEIQKLEEEAAASEGEGAE